MPSSLAPLSAAPAFGLSPRDVLERARVLTVRALTLPAYVWPFSKIASALAHGEPLTGPTARSAAREALRAKAERGVGVVVGRLAWELRDPWSVRGAERSYLRLIDALAEAKERDPGLDAAVSFDLDSLGLQLRGPSGAERLEAATAAALRLSRAAADRGLPVEFDVGQFAELDDAVAVARRVASELRLPVRLAIPARYAGSVRVLREWADLAERLGVGLGVRLVKGSFIEAGVPGAANERGELFDRYARLITLALERADVLDVAVASHNPRVWDHARREAARLGAEFSMNVIRGINPELQEEMRRAGRLSREYVSYGLDAPGMGAAELLHNRRERRALAGRVSGIVD
ncbi:MAG: proline dehydrogenase family protein [Proteobacteria bacterium]|nr:proline dehydrogenase family protein [Pseudomonadota bacterium]